MATRERRISENAERKFNGWCKESYRIAVKLRLKPSSKSSAHLYGPW